MAWSVARPRRAAGPVLVASAGIPYSSDPLDQDSELNSLGLSPVQATLVTRSRKGGVTGVLAESWEADPDFRVWRFRMRPAMTWETGERITAEHVLSSWRRAAALLERRGVQSGLFERLQHGPGEAGVGGRLVGVVAGDGMLVLRFKDPFPDLLDVVSRPLFAAVHPSCYSPGTGEWSCRRRAVASGPYRVSRWSDSAYRLELRPGFPSGLRHPRAPAEFIFAPDVARGAADLAVGASIDEPPSESMTYWGGMESTVAYLRCQSWSHPESVFASPAARKALRAAFYREFRAAGGRPRLSFLPLAAVGVKEAVEAPAEGRMPASLRGKRLSFRASWSFTKGYQAAVEKMAVREGLLFEDLFIPKESMRAELAGGLPRYHNDLIVALASMGAASPTGSVREMFLTQEGVLLPDPSGRARAELAKPTPDLQAVNQVLWDDAIVWPVQHFGMGFWVKPRLDASVVNFDVSPPALEWVGLSE